MKLDRAERDILDADAGTGSIPVVEVGNVNVIAPVVALARPHPRALQERNVLGFDPELARGDVVAGVVQALIVARLGRLVSEHGVVSELGAILAFEGGLVERDFRVGLALVAEAVLGICPRKLEARLIAALRQGRTEAAAHIAVELERRGIHGKHSSDSCGNGNDCKLRLSHGFSSTIENAVAATLLPRR